MDNKLQTENLEESNEMNKVQKSKAITAAKRICSWLIFVFAVFMTALSLIASPLSNTEGDGVLGYHMFVVSNETSSDSFFSNGDVIFAKNIRANTIAEGDVIAYQTPIGGDGYEVGDIITQKISLIELVNGVKYFSTYDEDSLTENPVPISETLVLGEFEGKVARLGGFLDFLKTTTGYVTCILLPFLLIILYHAVTLVVILVRIRKKKIFDEDSEREQAEAERAEAQKMMAELMAKNSKRASSPLMFEVPDEFGEEESIKLGSEISSEISSEEDTVFFENPFNKPTAEICEEEISEISFDIQGEIPDGEPAEEEEKPPIEADAEVPVEESADESFESLVDINAEIPVEESADETIEPPVAISTEVPADDSVEYMVGIFEEDEELEELSEKAIAKAQKAEAKALAKQEKAEKKAAARAQKASVREEKARAKAEKATKKHKASDNKTAQAPAQNPSWSSAQNGAWVQAQNSAWQQGPNYGYSPTPTTAWQQNQSHGYAPTPNNTWQQGQNGVWNSAQNYGWQQNQNYGWITSQGPKQSQTPLQPQAPMQGASPQQKQSKSN